jgi:hypothetical protein
MTYNPQDPGSPTLYFVKREFAEHYETGHASSIGPKHYLLGNAKTVAKRNNERNYSVMHPTLTDLEKAFEKQYAPGTWYHDHYIKTYGAVGGLKKLQEVKDRMIAHWHSDNAAGKWVVVPAIVSSGLPVE